MKPPKKGQGLSVSGLKAHCAAHRSYNKPEALQHLRVMAEQALPDEVLLPSTVVLAQLIARLPRRRPSNGPLKKVLNEGSP
jgi:hypothetical protein